MSFRFIRKSFIVILAYLFLAFPNNLYADRPGQSLIDTATNLYNFLKDIFNKSEFTTRVSQEYDSNIFLEEDEEDPDLKTSIYQGISLRSPKESKGDIYYQLDYGLNFDSYLQEGDRIFSHDLKGLLSYRPFDKLSFGISDNYKKVGKGTINTALGDRLITLGYVQNITNFQAKYDVNKDNYLDLSYGFYLLDVNDPARDEFIDRNSKDVNLSLNHYFDPNISGFMGYAFQEVRFDETQLKNSDSSRYLLGLTQKFPELFKLTGELGYEHKDIKTQRKDDNVDFKISANSLFSAYTKLSFLFQFERLQPSSRSEFSQYAQRNIMAQLEHYLTPKLSLTTNLGYERQHFDEKDSISSSVVEDRTTNILSTGLTLRRILNDWLSVDAGYNFTKRDSKFAAESNTDHRVTLGLTANY